MLTAGNVHMFDYESPKPEEEQPTDWTGLKIGGLLLPVFLLFVWLGNADMGLTACIVLGMIMLAIKLRWDLRRRIWFWVIIAVISALHIPLLFIIRWPQGKGPTLAYTMPIGIVDFALILGAVTLAEKIFLKGSSSDDVD